ATPPGCSPTWRRTPTSWSWATAGAARCAAPCWVRSPSAARTTPAVRWSSSPTTRRRTTVVRADAKPACRHRPDPRRSRPVARPAAVAVRVHVVARRVPPGTPLPEDFLWEPAPAHLDRAAGPGRALEPRLGRHGARPGPGAADRLGGLAHRLVTQRVAQIPAWH